MSNNDAENRRSRLTALRDKRKQQGGAAKGGQASDDHEKLRRLFAERRRTRSEGAGDGSRKPLLDARRRGGPEEAAPGSDRFPRLKQMLERRKGENGGRGTVTAASSQPEIDHYRDGLENLVDWLEEMLQQTRSQLDDVRGWEAADPDA